MPDDQKPSAKIPPSVLPSLTSVLVIAMSAILLKDFKFTPENIFVFCSSIAALVVAVVQYRKCNAAETGVRRAEESVPGITSPNGPNATHTVIQNDPTVPGPPTVISSTSLLPPPKELP